jgi:signal transduction histidine kinase
VTYPGSSDESLALALGSLEETLAAIISDRDQVLTSAARLLHDDVGQTLSAVGMQMEALRLDFADREPGISEPILALERTLEELMQRIRDLSYELNPSIVERVGLRFALERLVVKYRRVRKGGGLRLAFDPDIRVPQPAANGFYRIAECALDHATRHTDCTWIEIRVTGGPDSAAIEVVHDAALPPATEQPDAGGRLALLLLRHHAAAAGIPVTVESSPQRGTMIKAIISFSG